MKIKNRNNNKSDSIELKKINYRITIFFFTFLGFAIILYYMLFCYMNCTLLAQELIYNDTYMIKSNLYNNDLLFTKTLIQRFADNHKYNETDYNCKDYSMNLKFIANNLGLDIDTIIGMYNDSSGGHMWNKYCIHLEPQTGNIYMFDDIKN